MGCGGDACGTGAEETPKLITGELLRHAPFTAFGAITGIIIVLWAVRVPQTAAEQIFYTLHPIHVVLSALVTAGMYRLHNGKGVSVLLIGYIGSVGIATISDSLVPYAGELLLQLPNPGLHIGFIEKWWLVNPLAFLGIAIAYWRPTTKFPHAGHVLLSTWASTFHIVMAIGTMTSGVSLALIGLFLFLSVWLPCCLSDIIFPLLCVKTTNGEANNTYR
jgi:hypothetical protein